ncbi:division plane positioning ATPase MipZ [Pelagibacterium lentulum]|uniref:ATPase n=1 Tax=Pelagibacterium lentulum TaxID=2029865 RepID=A0A916RNC9_9HYPH|nr:division plane positioning ATPase MipZ [Pelagibacterium lentulum]GGA60622.1 ATPase [Pelagibacterium lentulum]
MQHSGAHVIVLGNEKGGSGKSTTAFHLATYLLYEGFRVATIDTDSRQHTLTAYIRNRREWTRAHGLDMPHSTHFHLPRTRSDSLAENNQVEFSMFRQAVAEVEADVDFIIVDTPGFDTNLTRLAHSLADTLVTPVNDSLIDLDVIARIDHETGETVELSHYTRLVQRARKERMAIDGSTIDWIVVRNRTANLASRNMRLVQAALDNLSGRIGFRLADGIAERVIFRSLFPIGMTVFDPLDADVLQGSATMSHVSARQEYRQLVDVLNLGLGERQRKRANLPFQALQGEVGRLLNVVG